MRQELVARIDPGKAKDYFFKLCGWSPEVVQEQVLTPVDESSLTSAGHADPDSIMCYQIPAEITVDDVAIPGGDDIDLADYTFAGALYPRSDAQRPLGGSPPGSSARHAGQGSGSPGMVVCFTPGSDPAYVAAVLRAVGGEPSVGWQKADAGPFGVSLPNNPAT